MQVECELTRKDDDYDTGDRRSVASHPILTKGLSQKSKTQSSRLEEELLLVLYKPRRTPMVERVYDSEEWAPNSQNSTGQSKDDNICRCFRYRLGSCFNLHQDVGILDRGGMRNVNKRPRVEDDLVCLTAPCRKVPRLDYPDFERQSYRNQICYESRWDFVNFTSRTSNQYTKAMQQTQHSDSMSTYSGNNRCHSGPSQQKEDPTIRSSIVQQDISENSTTLGPVNHRCIRDEDQQEAEEILESSTGSRSSGTGRFQPTVADEGFVSKPTLETNSQSVATNETTKDQESGFGGAILANTILVCGVDENETTIEANDLPNEEMDHDRMAIIRRSRQNKGVSKDAAKILLKATRRTIKAGKGGVIGASIINQVWIQKNARFNTF